MKVANQKKLIEQVVLEPEDDLIVVAGALELRVRMLVPREAQRLLPPETACEEIS